jgi:RHS repeat-associated protein
MVATEIPNDLNQLTSRTAGGAMKVQGALTEPASVTVNGVPARVDANNQFEGSASVTSGTNQFEVAATDGNGNTATQRYQVNVPAAAAVTQEYDLNGNLTRKIEAGWPITYEWDAANRLTAINNGTGRSEFEYDGLSHRVHAVEKESGMVISDVRFLWNSSTIAEERNASGAIVMKRFYSEGVQEIGTAGDTKYYYLKDHLGSIRDVTDGASVARACYTYDAFGKRWKLNGDFDADFGFSGYFTHRASGLDLTVYRGYDSATTKWISRDPIGEKGGLNRYGYVRNNPINKVDVLGLCPGDWWDLRTWFNSGLTDSLSDSALSISDALGGMLAYPLYGTAAGDQILEAGAYGPLGQAENNPAAYATEWSLLGISGLSAGAAATMLGGEVLASRGAFQLSEHVVRDSIGAEGRYYSEAAVRNAIANGARASNFAGETPIVNGLTTFRYPIGNNGQVVLNWATRTIVQYLPKW